MINKTDFLRVLQSSPEMALGIIRSLTQRLRDATEGSRSLALDNVYRRLADKLLELSEDAGDGVMQLSKNTHTKSLAT